MREPDRIARRMVKPVGRKRPGARTRPRFDLHPRGDSRGHDPQRRSRLPPARADQLIELALRLWQGGQRDNLHTLEPRYLRRSAAEEKWAAPPGITAPTKP